MYYNAWKNFNKFLVRLDQMPFTWERRVVMYCTFLIHERELKSTTIKSYISAIKAVLANDGYELSLD